jgi:hypothetical protein
VLLDPHPVISVIYLIWLAISIAQVVALVDAAIRPAQAYVAAGKLTKPAWLAILGLALVAVQFLGAGLGIFGLAAAVATIVYFVDVRPALRAVGGGGRRPRSPW